MQIWAETVKSALPIRNYSQILYQFLTFTQNLKRSRDLRLFIIHEYFFIVFFNNFFECILAYLHITYNLCDTETYILFLFCPFEYTIYQCS